MFSQTMFLFVLILPVVVPASGGRAGGDNPAESPTAIVIAGSQRMVPLLKRLADGFRQHHAEVRLAVQGGGSRIGIPMLCQGTATIASLARPINEREIQRVRHTLAQYPVGTPIAMDAVLFFVHPDNPITALSVEQVGKIFTYKIRSWPELGISLERIVRQIPNRFSGSLAIVRSRAMNGMGFPRTRTERADRAGLIRAVAADPSAIGFGGLGDTTGVKVVPLRAAEESPAVLPTLQAIQSRQYPLAHYLYLYTAGQPKGPAKAFITFALSPEGQEIVRMSETGGLPPAAGVPLAAGVPPAAGVLPAAGVPLGFNVEQPMSNSE